MKLSMPDQQFQPFSAAHWLRRSTARAHGSRYLLTFLAILFLLYCRRPSVLNNAQFWGEDATIFYLQQLSHGFFRALMTPYAGYINAVPRLVAALASFAPTICAPFIFNLIALVVAAGCCSIFVLENFRHIIASTALRFCICFLIATALYTEEIVGTITNIQWFLIIPAILLPFAQCESDKQSIWKNLGLALAIFLIACSTPLPLILVPFFLWRLFTNAGYSKIWPIAMLLGVALETFEALHMHAVPATTALPLNEVTTSLIISGVYRVILCSLAGASAAEWISTHNLSSVVLLTLILAVFGLTLLFVRTTTKGRITFLTVLYLSTASMGLALYGRHVYPNFQTLVNVGDWRGERYFFIAGCGLILLIALALESSRYITDPLTRSLILFTLFSGGIAGNFSLPAIPDFHWPSEARQFDKWKYAVSHGLPTYGALLPINPGGPWAILLPCRSLATSIPNLEGCLVSSGPQEPIYFIEHGQKRLIRNIAWFQSESEVRWPGDLKIIAPSELVAIHDGPPL